MDKSWRIAEVCVQMEDLSGFMIHCGHLRYGYCVIEYCDKESFLLYCAAVVRFNTCGFSEVMALNSRS